MSNAYQRLARPETRHHCAALDLAYKKKSVCTGQIKHRLGGRIFLCLLVFY